MLASFLTFDGRLMKYLTALTSRGCSLVNLSVVARFVAVAVAFAPLSFAQSQESGRSTETLASVTADTRDFAYRNTITILGGGLGLDRGNGWAPYGSIRLSRDLSNYFNAEIGIGHARPVTRFYSFTPSVQEFEGVTPFTAFDAALQAQLPMGAFTPYVGGSLGYFVVSDHPQFGGAQHGLSEGVMGGIKLFLTRQLGLRAELRVRRDHISDAGIARDFEQSLGLMYRF